MDIIISH